MWAAAAAALREQMMTVKTDAPPEASARSACPSARDKTKLFQISISLFFFFTSFQTLSLALCEERKHPAFFFFFFLMLLSCCYCAMTLERDAMTPLCGWSVYGTVMARSSFCRVERLRRHHQMNRLQHPSPPSPLHPFLFCSPLSFASPFCEISHREWKWVLCVCVSEGDATGV